MLSKIALFLFCLCLVQGSFADSEQETNGVTNLADAVLSRSRRSCGAGECNAHCKKLGHARGVCIGTYCQCRSRRRRSADEEQIEGKDEQLLVIAEDNLPVANLDENIQSDAAAIPSDVTKSRTARGTCGYDECNRFCRKLGHARGVCIGNYCQCRFRRRRSVDAPQDANRIVSHSAEAVLSRSRRSCGAGECNAHCKKLGHARGVCIGTYCQCRSR